MNGLALCAGIGGLEIGVGIAVPGYRCVGYVERDTYAASVLVARMEDETLDRAPIWDDLESFRGKSYRGKVDLISAGFPCQPWSQAGRQNGTDDERWIWPAIATIIRDVGPGPSLVFLENVPGLISGGGLGPVLGDLAEMGFDAEWGCFSAAEVGAPHRRERVFILGYAGGARWTTTERHDHDPRPEPATGGAGGMGVTESERLARGIESGNGSRGWLPWPPGPGDDWSGVEARAQPALCRVAHGDAPELEYRADRLRCLGNGVVPIQAAMAFRTLWGRLMV